MVVWICLVLCICQCGVVVIVVLLVVVLVVVIVIVLLIWQLVQLCVLCGDQLCVQVCMVVDVMLECVVQQLCEDVMEQLIMVCSGCWVCLLELQVLLLVQVQLVDVQLMFNLCNLLVYGRLDFEVWGVFVVLCVGQGLDQGICVFVVDYIQVCLCDGDMLVQVLLLCELLIEQVFVGVDLVVLQVLVWCIVVLFVQILVNVNICDLSVLQVVMFVVELVRLQVLFVECDVGYWLFNRGDIVN